MRKKETFNVHPLVLFLSKKYFGKKNHRGNQILIQGIGISFDTIGQGSKQTYSYKNKMERKG